MPNCGEVPPLRVFTLQNTIWLLDANYENRRFIMSSYRRARNCNDMRLVFLKACTYGFLLLALREIMSCATTSWPDSRRRFPNLAGLPWGRELSSLLVFKKNNKTTHQSCPGSPGMSRLQTLADPNRSFKTHVPYPTAKAQRCSGSARVSYFLWSASDAKNRQKAPAENPRLMLMLQYKAAES